jgi:hypothetical protein
MTFFWVAKALVALAVAQSVHAHSWVETVRHVSSNGAFVGNPGYAMGYIPRTSASFADDSVQNKITDLSTNPSLCRNFAGGGYTNANIQPINASAGDTLAMQWYENGHVTDPTLTPRGYRSGNVMIYGISGAFSNVSINDALYVWNADGTGGNKQGKLLASHFFDDEQCYQDRGTDTTHPIYTARKAKYNVTGELPCQGTFQLPTDLATSGTYTVAWVWDWPQNPNEVGSTTEIYTSCATINLSPASSNVTNKAVGIKVATNLNVISAAISSQIASPIEVLARGTGTAAPAAVADSTTAAGTATTTRATSSSGGNKHTSGIKTVTVTAAPVRITEYQTITVDSAGKAVGTASGSAVTVTQTATTTATANASSSLKTSLSASRSSSGARSSSASSETGDAVVTGSVVVTSVTPFVISARATGHLRRMR